MILRVSVCSANGEGINDYRRSINNDIKLQDFFTYENKKPPQQTTFSERGTVSLANAIS